MGVVGEPMKSMLRPAVSVCFKLGENGSYTRALNEGLHSLVLMVAHMSFGCMRRL